MTTNISNSNSEKLKLNPILPSMQRSTHFLDRVGRIPFVGSLAGLARMISALFFSVAFQFTKLYATRSGNLDLASKAQRNISRASGEFFRGLIELVPFAINVFEHIYSTSSTVAMGPYLFVTRQESAEQNSNTGIQYFSKKEDAEDCVNLNPNTVFFNSLDEIDPANMPNDSKDSL